MDLATLEDIRLAADRIAAVATRTPLLGQSWASGSAGTLWLKPESLQPIGAFKIRGAYNAIAALDPTRRARGVVAHSSGNHAQAVAFAAKRFGVSAHIVVPHGTAQVKLDATAAHGAEIIEVPATQRVSAAQELATHHGRTLIPPFDDLNVIAGQGTVGAEIVDELPEVDVVLVPVSGGGLAAGVGTAIKALRPGTHVYAVEPDLAADTAESLREARLVRWPERLRARTIADGLRAEPSELTFAHLHTVLDGVITVSEAEIRATTRVLATRARLVAEPSGAAASAAYLFHAQELPAGSTVAVLSGGNVEPAALAEMLATESD